jgi:hypothetical protein
MNSICIFLLACFSSGFSLPSQPKQPIEPKLCKNCKFFVKENFFTANKFGKCTLFNYEETKYFLVDGIYEKNLENYHYCSTARNYEHMCGAEGKKYEPSISTFGKS